MARDGLQYLVTTTLLLSLLILAGEALVPSHAEKDSPGRLLFQRSFLSRLSASYLPLANRESAQADDRLDAKIDANLGGKDEVDRKSDADLGGKDRLDGKSDADLGGKDRLDGKSDADLGGKEELDREALRWTFHHTFRAALEEVTRRHGEQLPAAAGSTNPTPTSPAPLTPTTTATLTSTTTAGLPQTTAGYLTTTTLQPPLVTEAVDLLYEEFLPYITRSDRERRAVLDTTSGGVEAISLHANPIIILC